MNKPLTKEEREKLRADCEGIKAFGHSYGMLNLDRVLRALADLDAKDAALEPFAAAARRLDPSIPDNLEAAIRVTAGDLRRAAEAKGEE